MLRVLFSLVGVAGRTASGLLVILPGISFIGLGITWLWLSTATRQFCTLAALACLVLCVFCRLGGALWRLSFPDSD